MPLNEDLTKTRNFLAKYKTQYINFKGFASQTWIVDGTIVVKDNLDNISVINADNSYNIYIQ